MLRVTVHEAPPNLNGSRIPALTLPPAQAIELPTAGVASAAIAGPAVVRLDAAVDLDLASAKAVAGLAAAPKLRLYAGQPQSFLLASGALVLRWSEIA